MHDEKCTRGHDSARVIGTYVPLVQKFNNVYSTLIPIDPTFSTLYLKLNVRLFALDCRPVQCAQCL